MENELKIRIIKDSKGNPLSLQAITLEAAESLKIFIDSLVELARLYEDNSEFKISLLNGSIESCLVFPAQNEQVTKDINDILTGKSLDNKKIKALKDIQDKIKSNGLDYEVLWKNNNEIINVTQKFKGENFSYKRRRNEYESEIVFLSGQLYETGGKTNTNIHIHESNIEYKIDCTVQEAIAINSLLYENIYLSALKTTRSEYKPTYQLIDYYLDINEQKFIAEFYQNIVSNDKLEKFDLLHEKIYDLILEDRLNDLKKMIKIFDNEFTERGIIRTILMSLKPVIKKDDFLGIKPLYQSLSDTLRVRSLNHTI
ncbi:hypothetical protein GO730_20970 [Spirosoma sp. HMF3257]|nr:hypothetical protein [Spirosoma telluris]